MVAASAQVSQSDVHAVHTPSRLKKPSLHAVHVDASLQVLQFVSEHSVHTLLPESKKRPSGHVSQVAAFAVLHVLQLLAAVQAVHVPLFR